MEFVYSVGIFIFKSATPMGPVMKQWKAPSSNSSSTLFPFFQRKGTKILVWSTYPILMSALLQYQ